LRCVIQIIAYTVGDYKQGNNNISTYAGNFSINISASAGLSQANPGTQENAVRHVVWQAMITSEFGADIAKQVGDVHESNPNADLNQRNFTDMETADQTVDLLNNQIGRKIGEENKGASNKTIAKKTMQEYKDNGLWTASKNKDGSISIQKNKITQEQYKAAIQEINKKGENGLNQ
jgi:hypothetical protein